MIISKKFVLLVCLFNFYISFAFGRPAEGTAAEAQKKWNIISIVTDDQGAWAVGAYGNKEIVTPSIDQLAREGILFTNAFACTGVCAPSRVSFITGLYPTQTGFMDVPYFADPNEGLPLGVPSWPRALQQHGYATGLIGKWHLGGNLNYYPTKFGLDYFFGFLRGANRPKDPVLMRGQKLLELKGSLPDILVTDAIQFLEKNQSKPFALMLHFRAPHAPHLPVPKVDLEPFKGLDPTVPVVDPEEARLDDDQEPAAPEAIDLHIKLLKKKMKSYYASIHSIDRNLGRLFAKLDELGLSENTIVLFTSDQGYFFGHRGLKGKGAAQPIRNHTLAEDVLYINCYDHALKIPLIIRWPGVVQPGTVNDELMSNIDTYATILGMLGIPLPVEAPAESMDFSPLLRGEDIKWRTEVFAQYTPDQIGSMEFIRMVRTKKWKLVRKYLNPGGNQLFDMVNDPGEMRNLYYLDRNFLRPDQGGVAPLKEHPYGEVLNDLQTRLTRWLEFIDDPVLAMEQVFDKSKKKAKDRWKK